MNTSENSNIIHVTSAAISYNTSSFLRAAMNRENLRVYSYLHLSILRSVAFRQTVLHPLELNIIIFSPPFWTNMVALMSTMSLDIHITVSKLV